MDQGEPTLKATKTILETLGGECCGAFMYSTDQEEFIGG